MPWLPWVLIWSLIIVGGLATDLTVTRLARVIRDMVNHNILDMISQPVHRRFRLGPAWRALAVALFAKDLLSQPLAAWVKGDNIGEQFPWSHPPHEAIFTLGNYVLDAALMAFCLISLTFWLIVLTYADANVIARGDDLVPYRARLAMLTPGTITFALSLVLHSHYTTDTPLQSVMMIVLTQSVLQFIVTTKVRKLGKPKPARPRRTLAQWLRWGLLLGIVNWLVLVGMWAEGNAQIVGGWLPTIAFLCTAMVIELIRSPLVDSVQAPFDKPDRR